MNRVLYVWFAVSCIVSGCLVSGIFVGVCLVFELSCMSCGFVLCVVSCRVVPRVGPCLLVIYVLAVEAWICSIISSYCALLFVMAGRRDASSGARSSSLRPGMELVSELRGLSKVPGRGRGCVCVCLCVCVCVCVCLCERERVLWFGLCMLWCVEVLPVLVAMYGCCAEWRWCLFRGELATDVAGSELGVSWTSWC